MAAQPLRVHVDGIGVWSPGLAGWAETRAVLTGAAPYVAGIAALPAPAVLPAAERRRSPATAKIAIQVALEACAMAQAAAAELPSVFASSHGDTEISDYLCRELAARQPLSPTRFHNSVHNAPSGYWTIATGCMQSACALSAGPHSFAYGLLEAATQSVSGNRGVLLVAYDLAAPAPLSSVCSISHSFGVALVLAATASDRSIARLECRADAAGPACSHDRVPGLEALMDGNPAAGSLPLLSCMAKGQAAALELPPFRWEITPCR